MGNVIKLIETIINVYKSKSDPVIAAEHL